MEIITPEAKKLYVARNTIPWLKDVPIEIYRQLDPRDWVIPFGVIERQRRYLELITDANVMAYTYKSGHWDRPVHQHLCGVIATAQLEVEQLAILKHVESLSVMMDVSFAAYEKPVRLIDPQNSLLSNFLSAWTAL